MDRDFIKQVRFKLQGEVDDLNAEIRECNTLLYPIGVIVTVKRAKGLSRVTMKGFKDLSDPNKFLAKSRTGNNHWFDISNIIE